MTHSHTPGVGTSTPMSAGKEKPRHQGHQGDKRTSDSRKHTEFPTDLRGVPILDAAGLEVLKAWRYFNAIPGDLPAIAAALLVVAWAIRGRL